MKKEIFEKVSLITEEERVLFDSLPPVNHEPYTKNGINIILEVLEYIDTNYADGTLANFCKLSQYEFHHVSRELKRNTGKTFTGLLQEKRLKQAAFLLKTTKMHVADISITVGYNNTNYFHKIFEKQYGMSPKKYRDSINQR